jgi:hypothetical protein
MSCNCGNTRPGTNCQCSRPIALAGTGSTGATGATGPAGADGVANLYNDLTVVSQSGVYSGTMATYSLDKTTHLSVNGDKIKIIVVFEASANAKGTMGVYSDGNLLGDTYVFVPGSIKQMKMEIIMNRASVSAAYIDQMWVEVPSATGDSADLYAYPNSGVALPIAANFNITVNATQNVIGENIYVKQFSIERMKLTI